MKIVPLWVFGASCILNCCKQARKSFERLECCSHRRVLFRGMIRNTKLQDELLIRFPTKEKRICVSLTFHCDNRKCRQLFYERLDSMAFPIPIFCKTLIGCRVRCRPNDCAIRILYYGTLLDVLNHPHESIVSAKAMVAFWFEAVYEFCPKSNPID